MSDTRRSARLTTCESCGKDPAAPPAPDDLDAEPITHCEWCGAEYPTPEPDSAGRTSETPTT